MRLSLQIATHVREVHFGRNWASSSLRENLEDITWEQAITKIQSFNTIVTLVYHMNYYVHAVLEVLRGNPLKAQDKLSFDHPPIKSEEDWQQMLEKTWNDAENFANAIEGLPENKFWEDFSENKYGNYYRNIHGVIEHIHYHLGQIALIRKTFTKSEK